jgi:NAD(P)-dependent dehydrogenase (short-subunit alcohol dehydrogenase family)
MICVVTGASSGIGEATARALASSGRRVVMLCRDPARANAAADRIRAEVPGAELAIEQVDLASLASVRACVARLRDGEPIRALVLNAGTTTRVREQTEDGFERTLAVDFLGPFALTLGLIERLRAGAPARVVQLAGIYHRRGTVDLDDLHFERGTWSMMRANNRAQLARVIFACELARRLEGQGVTVNAVHPGAVRTRAQESAPWWGKLLLRTVARPFFVDPDRGAAPVVRLVLDPSLEGTTGRFFDRDRDGGLCPAARDRTLARALWERAEQETRVAAMESTRTVSSTT